MNHTREDARPLLAAAPAVDRHANEARRKTKIVCTAGPASCERAQFAALIAAGADVFRLNFSHADHAWHEQTFQAIRQAERQIGRPVAVMQDLCGPKIRVSRVAREEFAAGEGERVRLTTEANLAAGHAVDYDVASSYAALLDDGRVELVVEMHTPQMAVTRVVRGGPITVGKGINLPGVELSTPSVTAKDWEDIDWALGHDVDLIALSFVRHPDDLSAVRRRLDEADSRIRLVAKIERPEAITHISEIIAAADGLMVARGDLGLETDLARVPLLQKHLIEKSRRNCKPVITATQMLDSMIHHATPTRAEVSDVANAIYDGSDAIMLSGETATGRFPVRAVQVLDRVARVAEMDLDSRRHEPRRERRQFTPVAAIVEGAVAAALSLAARRVVVYSQSGSTARQLARYRLPMPVTTVTNDATTCRQLCLSYGVEPIHRPDVTDMPQLLAEIDQLAIDQHWGAAGDRLVVVSALDGRAGNTDTMHVHEIRAV